MVNRALLLCTSVLALVACSGGGTGSGSTAGSSGGSSGTAHGSTTTGGSSGGSTSGTSAGSATVTGTILGASFTPQDAISEVSSSSTFVVLTSYSGVCALAMADPNASKANSSTLVFDFSGGATARAFSAPNDVDAQFANFDATCGSPSGESASGGTVTVTRADATGIDGTFDLFMDSATTGHITGTFSAPTCAAPASDGGFSCR
ncbi:MAG: hypothetical protein JST54_23975 [Deltaproteobacteria bacterium]|nr:hypothetical protein [Deltaproteobacteria bacterium]